MRKWLLVLVAIGGLIVAPLIPALAYEGGPVSGGGVITGSVKFTGAIPAPKKLKVDKDTAVCGTDKPWEGLLVNKANRGIQNAVVSIVGINKGKPMEIKPVSIDQRRCAFTPHVVLIPAGAPLDILNSDGILHNIHTYSIANPPINLAQPKTRPKITKKFEKPEIVKVTCDAHKWMSAWLIVMDNPYYAVTDDNGNFKLTDVPPGTYKIQVWHEALGKQTREVTVKEKGEVSLSFELTKKE